MELFVFYLFAMIAVASAVMVVAQRRVIYSVLSLIVTFGATAVLFFQLGAYFLAAIQVIVYAGAIMILFLFVVMLLDPETEVLPANPLVKLSILVLPFIGILLVLVLQAFPSSAFGATGLGGRPGGEVETIALSLFREYLLPFEATAVLILVAVIGAVLLTKRPD